MLNLPGSSQNSGSYVDLLKRMTGCVQQKKVDGQILDLLRQVFEKEFDKENIVLSRSEKTRLLNQITKTVLADLLGKIDNT